MDYTATATSAAGGGSIGHGGTSMAAPMVAGCVALLYAELSIEEKTIGLCSAGQTQPIVRSAASNAARLIETEGH